MENRYTIMINQLRNYLSKINVKKLSSEEAVMFWEIMAILMLLEREPFRMQSIKESEK